MAMLLFLSCKKDKSPHTTVKGIVQEAGSLKPVGGATILLRGRDVNCFSCGTNTVASYSADANGVYSFDFTASEGISYDLGVSKNKYYDNINNNIVIDIGEINENKNIVLDPEAYLKIHVKNVSPMDQADYIYINGGGGPYSGMKVDTFSIRTVRGNMNNSLTWFVTKKNIDSKYSNTIFCLGFDTTMFAIEY